MLTVHHLRRSQSERIVWLCEELGLDYTLQCWERNTTDLLAPPGYKALHPMGIAPVIVDGDITLGESGAIVEYLLARCGPGELVRGPQHADFADYLYWLHFANGTLQPVLGRNMILRRIEQAAGHPVTLSTRSRLALALAQVDARCAASPYLGGAEFSAADIMNVFSLTTMRSFMPVDLAPHAHIRAYLRERIGTRAAYRRAMAKGDPGMEPMLG